MNWIPRDQNSQADFFSKIVDFDDYYVIDDVFFHLEELWGPHSVDRFACYYNAKLLRFNSRFLQPGTEAVDAFSQDWSSDIRELKYATFLSHGRTPEVYCFAFLLVFTLPLLYF